MPAFTTVKLMPQIAAMSNKPRSVVPNDGRAAGATAGGTDGVTTEDGAKDITES